MLAAGDKRDLTQFVSSNVRGVINPSEMGIHHRDQPELGFGESPSFDFSQLNPSGPTLGTSSASHPTPLLLPGTKPAGHQLRDVSCQKPGTKGRGNNPQPFRERASPKIPGENTEFRSAVPLPWLFNTCKAKQKKTAQKMLRPNPGTWRHRGGSRWNQ